MKLFLKILLGSVASFVGYLVGWVAGATWAGNYADTMRFAGQVGFEAGGLIGGVVFAILASFVMVWALEKKKVRQMPLFLGALLGGVVTCLLVWQLPPESVIMIVVLILPGLGAVIASEIVRFRSSGT